MNEPVTDTSVKKTSNLVFLKRNQEKMRRKRETNIVNCLRINGIEFMVITL